MVDEDTVYDDLEVPTVINGAGTKTRVGGSLIREDALEAMREAASAFVRLSDLQAKASEVVAEATGAEAGYVASGGAACLTLAAAACIAEDDPAVMARLPETNGVADEIVMPRTHRTGYDHALRGAGATIVDVGTNDRHLGTGSADVEPWELADAITEDTAAVGYVAKPYLSPDLETVAEIAHANDVPVIVDAAAELPPTSNLEYFIEAGADLVAFSGGKAIRGPQTTGILAGRKRYIESAALQHLDMHAAADVWDPPNELLDPDSIDGVPRQGIGRPMKVGKEELVGLIVALEAFLEEDHDARREEWRVRAETIAAGLEGADALEASIAAGGKSITPEVVVQVDEDALGRETAALVLALRQEEPRVFVGADRLEDTQFTVNPMCLTEEEAEYLVERVLATLEGGD
ncbi:aminotransferase class V-fold PLP-dependent enzyme [Natrialbaceae archaeon A-gly3]